MVVYRVAKSKYIHDLTGEGAFRVGGRWNSQGKRVLYCSTSISLCMMEVLAHVKYNEQMEDMCLLALEVDDDQCYKVRHEELPPRWNDVPLHKASQEFGDELLSRYDMLLLPSVVVEREYNCIINASRCPDVKVLWSETIKFDKRYNNDN